MSSQNIKHKSSRLGRQRTNLENKYASVHEQIRAVKNNRGDALRNYNRSVISKSERKEDSIKISKEEKESDTFNANAFTLEHEKRFPEYLCYQPFSRNPRQTIDFSRWAEYIDDSTMEKLGRTTKGILCQRSSALRDEQCASIGKFCKNLNFIECTRCPELTDRGIRNIIRGCRSIRQIDFTCCHLIGDKALSAIGALGKMLRAISLEGCTRLTDHGIVGLTKNCLNITSMNLSGCINVTDRSISSMSQNLSLEVVDISSCGHVTEDAIGELIASFERMERLKLNKLSNVGDNCMRNVFENKLLFGYKRNTGCTNLRELQLNGNYSITEVTLTWLASSCENLRILTLSNCVGMGSISAMARLGQLANLEELNLAHVSTLTDRSLEAFFGGRSRKRLKSLDLSFCELLSDVGIRHVAKSCKNLDRFKLARNIDVTDESLLVLSRHCLLLTDIQFCDMPRITSTGLAAFLQRCSRIENLNLSGCTNVTEEGLTPIIGSPNLRTLSLGGCKKIAKHEYANANGPKLEFLDISKLVSTSEITLSHLATQFGSSLKSINLSNCINISEGAIAMLLDHCPALREVELSGTRLSPESLSRLAENHRYLDVVYDDPKFRGLRYSLASLDIYTQNIYILWHLKCQVAARRIQRMRRRRILEQEKNKKEARILVEGNRSAILIQKSFRGYVVRKLLTREKRVEYIKSLADEAATLVALIRKRNYIQNHKRAKYHYEMWLQRRTFRAFQLHWESILRQRKIARDSLIHLSENSSIIRKWRTSNQFIAWVLWIEYLGSLEQDRAREVTAYNFWLCRMTTSLFHDWLRKIKDRKKLRHHMAAIFLNCVAIDHYNSNIGGNNASAAVGYFRKMLLTRTWQGLLEIYTKFILPDHKAWINFYGRRLQRLVATRLWVRWVQYKRHQQWKVSAFRASDKHFMRTAWARSLKILTRYISEKEKLNEITNSFRTTALQRRSFSALKVYLGSRRRKHMVTLACMNHHKRHLLFVGFAFWRGDFEKRVLQLRKAQGLRMRSKRVFMQRVLKAWKARIRSLQHKKAAALLDRIHAGDIDSQNERAVEVLNRTARLIQTKWRGMRAREKVKDYRATFAWATILLQASIRRLIAKRLVDSMRKERFFKLKIREAVEREHMEEEENYASERRRLDYFQCRLARFAESIRLINIQNWWRTTISKYRAIFMLEQKALSLKKANERQAEIEAQIEKAAKTIQRAWRGGASWTNLLRLIRNRKRRNAAIMMQSRFRVRKAFRYLCSLRRSAANAERIQRARIVQAAVLRVVGIKSRKTQQHIRKKITSYGLDSDSMVYSMVNAWDHLKGEISDDYKKLRDEILIERTAWSASPFNKGKRAAIRRKLYRQHFKTAKVRKGDVVVVTLPGDPDFGRTGLVVDLDVYERFPGRFVAEVLFDGTNRVRPMPLFAKQEKEYTLMTMHQYPRYDYPLLSRAIARELSSDDFRAKLLNTAHILRIKQTVYIAARTIQTAIRQRLAHHRVARLRFKFATRIQSRRRLVVHLIGGLGFTRKRTRNLLLKNKVVESLDFPQLASTPEVPLRYSAELSRMHRARLRRLELAEMSRARYRFVSLSKRINKGFDMPASINFRSYSIGKKVRSDVIVSMIRHHRILMNSARMLAQSLNFQCSVQPPASISPTVRFLGNYLYDTLVPKIMNQRVWCIQKVFEQFDDTPHCRANGPLLYSGEFTGHPLNGNFIPHGEGLIEFPIGRGYAPDNCELYVTVVEGRNLATDALLEASSNLYIEVHCNEKTETTKAISGENSPKWNEEFCIEVSDPGMILSIRLLEKTPGVFANDISVGFIDLNLKDFDLGEKYMDWYTLIDEKDRGKDISKLRKRRSRFLPEVKLKISWIASTEASAVLKRRLHRDIATKLQAWVRRLIARKKLDEKLAEKENDRTYVETRALHIQLSLRQYWSRKKVFMKVKARQILHCIMFRGYWKIWAYGKCTFFAARKIQRLIRGRVATVILHQLQLSKLIETQLNAVLIQRVWRGHRVRYITPANRSFDADHLEDDYGYDHVFGTRRIGRFVKAAFVKLLRHPTSQGIVSRFGRVFLMKVVCRNFDSADVELNDTYLMSIEKLVVRVPGYGILSMPKDERLPIVENATKSYFAYLHPSAIDMIKTVNTHIILIQCLVRSKILTWKATYHKLRALRAVKNLQQKWRQWKKREHSSALLLQSIVRRLKALRKIDTVKTELECIVSIQALFRGLKGRRLAYKMLHVRESTAIYSSSQLDSQFSAYRTSDFSESSFWCSANGEIEDQYITYDLGGVEGIQCVQLLAPEDTSCPYECTLFCSDSSKDRFIRIFDFQLRRQKGIWQYFPIYFPGRARYWKLWMRNNWGSSTNMSLYACLFVRAQGSPLKVVMEPNHVFWPKAPPVPVTEKIQLECNIIGWPPPEFQWMRNGKIIEGANKPKLQLDVNFPDTGRSRDFMCEHCKRGTRDLLEKLVLVQCGYCNRRSDLGKLLRDETKLREAERHFEKLKSNIDILEGRYKRRFPGNGSIRDTARLRTIKKQIRALKEELLLVPEKRRQTWLKYDKAKAWYDCEGSFQCVARHVRGGREFFETTSPVVVLLGPPPFLRVDVEDLMEPPMLEKRILWPLYRSLYGCFVSGRVQGNVVIRYASGDTYSGPYIPDTYLDKMGDVWESMLPPTHIGIWETRAGVVYEGHSVTNHFDVARCHGMLKITDVTGEEYRGDTLGGKRHGVGKCQYIDGSRYEGHWYFGHRRGFGCFVDTSGNIYEGEWTSNMMTNHGSWHWKNGTSYIGPHDFGVRSGHGMYSTGYGDIYVGNFQNNKIDGKGLMLYNDRTYYKGDFSDGQRSGQGCMVLDGGKTLQVGPFRNDVREGIFTVRRAITMEDGAVAEETQRGVWKDNVFCDWLEPPHNPRATQTFVERFRKGVDFQGPFAAMVVQNLPKLPPGVDFASRDVRDVILRFLRYTDQSEVGAKSYLEATSQLDMLAEKIKLIDVEIEARQPKVESVKEREYEFDRQITAFEAERDVVRKKRIKLADGLKEFWAVEENEVIAARFNAAVHLLDRIEEEDWVQLSARTHFPITVKYIYRALCSLLGVEYGSVQLQMLFSSSGVNIRRGDDYAKYNAYDVQMLHLLDKFDVYTAANPENIQIIEIHLADPKVDHTNIVLKQFSVVIPRLVVLLRTALPYLKKTLDAVEPAKNMRELDSQLEKGLKRIQTLQEKKDGLSLRYQHLQEEQEDLKERKAVLLGQYTAWMKVKETCVEITDLSNFEGYEELQKEEKRKLDYYESLLNDENEKSEVAVIMELLISTLVERVNLKSKPGDLDIKKPPDIVDIMEGSVEDSWHSFIEEHKKTNPDQLLWTSHNMFACSQSRRQVLFEEILPVVKSGLNDMSNNGFWILPNGEIINFEVLAIIINSKFDRRSKALLLENVENEWRSVFPEDTASKAIEARFNTTMSDSVRERAKLWESTHKSEIDIAERQLSKSYEEIVTDEKLRPRIAHETCLSRKNFEIVTKAEMWKAFHPREMDSFYKEQAREQADLFEILIASQLNRKGTIEPRLLADQCVDIIMLRDKEEENEKLLKQAEAWASCHLIDMADAERRAQGRMAKQFAKSTKADSNLSQKAVMVTRPGNRLSSNNKKLAMQAMAWKAKYPSEYQIAKRKLDEKELEESKLRSTRIRRLFGRIEAQQSTIQSEPKNIKAVRRKAATKDELSALLVKQYEYFLMVEKGLNVTLQELLEQEPEPVLNERPSEIESRKQDFFRMKKSKEHEIRISLGRCEVEKAVLTQMTEDLNKI